MIKTVLVFGLIAGAILSGLMAATLPFMDRVGLERAEVIGYTTMVAAFLLVFFGIRSYRENVGRGAISFGRAFAVGALITLVAAVCYVATWQVIKPAVAPDFMEQWAEHQIEQAREGGASEEEIAQTRARMERYAELYANPLFSAALTLLEPLPVGLIMTLVSAGILRRREEDVRAHQQPSHVA